MPKILVVDDSRDSREPLVRLLRLQGYQMTSAADGLEALELTAHQTPDLILLDIMMPAMDGLTFLQHLRADPRLQSVPVILVTAIADRQTLAAFHRLGATVVLTKSKFTFTELLASVREALSSRPGAPGGIADARGIRPLA